jgi:hypothetical protein
MTNQEEKQFLRQEKIRHILWRISMLIPRCIRNGWDNLCYFLKPRQRWLTKQIPNHWVDKDRLWEICILEGIKHYVEKDAGLGYKPGDYEFSQNDPTYPEHQAEFDGEVKSAYEDIIKTLPALEKQLEEAWAKIPHRDITKLPLPPIDYHAVYGETDRLEEDIANLKTRIMVWAVTNRDKIWT